MPKKIIVVDDDPDSLKIADSILKSNGYEVITLSDPKFIFKTIKTEKPALVISDIIMPHSDGYALCQEIRKLYGEKIAVLLCTAQSYEEGFIGTAYKDFVANGYLIKPFVAKSLVEKVQAILDKMPQEPQVPAVDEKGK